MKTNLTFAAGTGSVTGKRRTPDGAIIMMGRPLRSGDYDYLAYEVPGAEQRGYRWDQIIVGRLIQSEADKTADKFKGLPIVDEHITVPIGERGELAIGTVLNDATIVGEWLECEHLIHDPKAILKIDNDVARELSVGGEATYRWAEAGDGQPHFYIEDVELNHVALVEEGRAGPEGRLLNHKAKLENCVMKTITIGGQTFQVDDVVEAEFSRLTSTETDLNGQLANARASTAAVTTERDTALGQVAVANAQIATLNNTKPDMTAEAVKIANAHSAFADQAKTLGYDKDLTLGGYDERAIKLEILNGRKAALPADASADMVNGAWLAALSFAPAETSQTSPIDGSVLPPAMAMPSDRAAAAIQNSYFKPASKAAKQEGQN